MPLFLKCKQVSLHGQKVRIEGTTYEVSPEGLVGPVPEEDAVGLAGWEVVSGTFEDKEPETAPVTEGEPVLPVEPAVELPPPPAPVELPPAPTPAPAGKPKRNKV